MRGGATGWVTSCWSVLSPHATSKCAAKLHSWIHAAPTRNRPVGRRHHPRCCRMGRLFLNSPVSLTKPVAHLRGVGAPHGEPVDDGPLPAVPPGREHLSTRRCPGGTRRGVVCREQTPGRSEWRGHVGAALWASRVVRSNLLVGCYEMSALALRPHEFLQRPGITRGMPGIGCLTVRDEL